MHIGKHGPVGIDEVALLRRILFCRTDENAQDLQLVLEVNQSLLALVPGVIGLSFLASLSSDKISVLAQSA